MTTMFQSMAVRNYRLWFAGALVSNIGVWMQRVAQDWLVLTELTDEDATAVGVTMALNFAPQLLLVPITGVVADRFDRRRMLMLTQVSMGMLGLGLGILTLTGIVQLWMVFVFAGCLGLVAAFDAPVRHAFVSELVPAGQLTNAVALNAASFNTARLIGPAVAGLLVAVIGPGWVFVVNAASFAAVLSALALLRRNELVQFTRSTGKGTGLRAGIRYIGRRPDILLVLLMIFLVGTFGFNFSIYIATMARVEFDQGPDVFGVLSSVVAIGSLMGSLLSARRERPRLRVLSLAALGMGLALGLAALAPNIWAFGAAFVGVGFTAMTTMTTANAYVQTTTKPSMRGRVMAIYLAVFLGGTPIGAPLVGIVVDAFGPRWGLVVGTVAGMIAGLIAMVWYARSSRMRLRWMPQRRWPLALSYGRGPRADRELATTEIATIEAETRR